MGVSAALHLKSEWGNLVISVLYIVKVNMLAVVKKYSKKTVQIQIEVIHDDAKCQ